MTNCKAISCVGVCDVNKVEREGFFKRPICFERYSFSQFQIYSLIYFY